MYLELTLKTKLNLASFILKICETKRHKRLDTHSTKVFKTLCDELLRSTTVAAYEAAKWQLHAFIADQADSNNSLCIDLKSFHCPKMQRKNSKRQNSLWQVANNAVELLNAMPVHTSQIPCQPCTQRHTSRSKHTSSTNICFSSYLIQSKVWPTTQPVLCCD